MAVFFWVEPGAEKLIIPYFILYILCLTYLVAFVSKRWQCLDKLGESALNCNNRKYINLLVIGFLRMLRFILVKECHGEPINTLCLTCCPLIH